MENYYLGNGRRWTVEPLTEYNPDDDPCNPEIPPVIRRLLAQRGMKSQKEMQAFLNPSLEDLHDPFLLDGMDRAVDRIISAMEKKEKILIYGDYDADGVSATSILLRFFDRFGIHPEFYIPDRIDEGYGISDIAVNYISSSGFDLVITVDCGISGRAQIEAIYEKYANSGKSIDIIITDHHQCNDDLMPDALAILNPHLPGSQYPFKYLCGAGVAFKLVQALGIRMDKPDIYRDCLDIAAIATIADIVPLTGENRIITSFGMDKMTRDPCTGLKALMKVSLADGGVDSYRLSYIIAPRINAAGRMGDARTAVRLFTTEDEAEAERIAVQLSRSNTERQQVQEEIYREAVGIIEKNAGYKNEKVLVVYNKGWHHGVIGIVASKLVDRYHKPAFVLSADGDADDDIAVGSGRSIEGFNMFNAMEAQADLLVRFGGHEQAGGLKIRVRDIEEFRSRINTYADPVITEDMLIPEIRIDMDAGKDDISIETAEQIGNLKPFGTGNPVPVLCYRGAVLLGKRVIGDGKHLRLLFDIGGRTVEGVFFGKGYIEKGLFAGDKTDIVFTQEINGFRGTQSLQIKLLDIRLAEPALTRNRILYQAALRVECLDWDEKWFDQRSRTGPESLKLEMLDGDRISSYNGIIDKIIKSDDILVNRDILAVIYKYVRRMATGPLSVPDIFVHARILENEAKKNINFFKFFVSLLVFDELGLMEFSLGADGLYRIGIIEGAGKVDLGDSEILDWVSEIAASME